MGTAKRPLSGGAIAWGGRIAYLLAVGVRGGPERSLMGVAVAGQERGRADAYAAALRHSRRVARLKVALPVLAVVISLAFIAVSWVRTMIPDNLSIFAVKIENGKIVMERPAISGMNFDGISYYMKAARALQDIRNPYQIAFESIEAAIPVDGEVMARFSAARADFDRGKDRLALDQPFSITLSSGISASFRSARIDIPAGEMSTPDPVSITAQGSGLVAQSLEIKDKGRVIVLTGPVRMTIDPKAFRSSQKDDPS